MVKTKFTIKNEERRNRIANILSTFRGLKNTTSITTRRKNILVTHMQDKDGDNNNDRPHAANVFAEFYEELYTSTTKTRSHEHEDKYEHQGTMKPFTLRERNDAINQLKRGKATNTRGVNAKLTEYSTRKKTQKAPATTVQQSHQTPRATTTELERHDDQRYIQERGTDLAIELPTHLFDPHLVQTLQPTSLQTTTTHTRRQPNR